MTLLPRSFDVPRKKLGCAPDTPALTRVVHEIGGGAGPEPVDPGPKPRRGCRTCFALASLSFGADSDRGCDESVMTRGRPSAGQSRLRNPLTKPGRVVDHTLPGTGARVSRPTWCYRRITIPSWGGQHARWGPTDALPDQPKKLRVSNPARFPGACCRAQEPKVYGRRRRRRVI